MSLINDMLRDLEARDVKPPAASVRTTPPRRVRRASVVLSITGLLATGLLGYGLVARQAGVEPPAAAISGSVRADEPARPVAPGSGGAESPPIGSVTDNRDTPATVPMEQPGGPSERRRSAPIAAAAASAALAELAVSAADPVSRSPENPAHDRTASAAPVAPTGQHEPAAARPSHSPVTLREPPPATDPQPDVQQPAAEPKPEIVVRRSGGAGDPAGEAMASARRTLARGRAEVAIAQLERWLAREPDHVEARVLLARTLAASGRGHTAERRLADGLEYAPGSPELAFWLARLRLDRGAGASALEVLERHAPPLPGRADYHLLLAATLRQLGRDVQALERYRAIAAAEPGNGRAWLGAAVSLEALGRPDAARQAYENALAGDHDASARFARERLVVLGAGGAVDSNSDP